jgi:hypothetical protein
MSERQEPTGYEPEAIVLREDATRDERELAAISAAISLKRIADVLETFSANPQALAELAYSAGQAFEVGRRGW